MKKWVINRPDPDAVDILVKAGINPLATRVLISNGFDSAEKATAFFGADKLSDPFLIKDMRIAADFIAEMAFDENERVCVYGDYDCDGVCAAVILTSFLLSNGADVVTHINSRSEGFGLNAAVIERLAAEGIKLIITVDNGISAIHEAELIRRLGMSLVITDHHTPGADLPVAAAVVDPHREDETAPFREYSGAGVALMLVAAMMEGDTDSAVEAFSDIAALATIADMVPVIGENRNLIHHGLHYLEHTENPGLKALIDIAGIKAPFSPTDLGFSLGPRINAAGRLAHADLAFELLSCEDPDKARELAKEIDGINKKRKTIESEAIESAQKLLSDNPSFLYEPVLCLYLPGVHHGVVGLTAGRLLERFGKPVFIMTDEGDGYLRGSARSVPGFSVYEALSSVRQALTKYGGHELAGGFSLKREDLPKLRELLCEYARYFRIMPIALLSACADLSPADLTLDNAMALSELAPFGQGFEEPLFLIRGAVIKELSPLSEGKHTRISALFSRLPIKVVYFGISPELLGYKPGDAVDIMVRMGVNSYGGRDYIDLKAVDMRLSGVHQQKMLNAAAAYESFKCGNDTDKATLSRVTPSRGEFSNIYKQLKEAKKLRIAELYERNAHDINYFKLRLILDVFGEAGLCTVDLRNGIVYNTDNPNKADLSATVTMKRLT